MAGPSRENTQRGLGPGRLEETCVWNVIICDDEREMCKTVRARLDQFSKECGVSFSVQECYSGHELLRKITPDTDLLLLDIGMDAISGMEAAREIRRRNQTVCIIFITTMTQYAVEGYQVHAYGFLKKPLRYASFRLQMLDTIRHLQSRQQVILTVKAGGSVYQIPAAQVVYLEVQNHDIRVVQVGGTLTCSTTMKELEQTLVGKGFFRCHKSYCVNLRHIVRISNAEVELTNGERVPVSKHRRKEFAQAFAAYLGSGAV